MRIAALVTQARGGPVDHAVDVACELARRGHDSHLVGPVPGYAAQLRRAGVRWHDLSIETKTDVAGALRLRRLLREMRPDVLHLQDRRAGLVGRLVGRSASRRVVYTMHGVPDGLSDLVAGNARVAPRTRRDTLLYLHIEPWLDRIFPTEIIVPCEALVPYAVEDVGLPPERVRIVPNGIDPDRFAPAGSRPETEATTILWLGVMAPVKRVDRLVHAMVALPTARLVLVGDGPERQAIETLVSDLELRDRVEFQGFVADPAAAFAQADLFALPSGAEACPLALLQAMSSGLPVVASRVGGIPDVVRDGVDGLLVGPDDAHGLDRSLRDLVEDVERRRAMGAQARARILSGYSLSICVDQLLEAYAG